MTNTKRRLLSLTLYRGITVGVVAHPWDVTPSSRYYRECGPQTAVSLRLPRYYRRRHTDNGV